MGQKHWSKEEKECLLNFILPHSIYARGYHDDKNGGMTFEELAKVMQARMKAQGIENREYTQGILFQKYYQTMARAGKKRATGPHIKLSKQKLEKVKELRAWLDRNRVDDDDDEDEENDEHGVSDQDDSPYPHQQHLRPRHHPKSQTNPFNMAPQRISYHHPASSQDESPYPPQHQHPHPQHHTQSQYPHLQHHPQSQHHSFNMAPQRTSYHHPFPQLSPGGTMRRIYDDEDICPPEAPNYLSVYGAREPTKFIIPWFPEENIFTYIEKERVEKKTAEYNERVRAEKEQEQEQEEYDDFDDYDDYDDYPGAYSLPHKRVSKDAPKKSADYNKRTRAEQEEEEYDDLGDYDDYDDYNDYSRGASPPHMRKKKDTPSKLTTTHKKTAEYNKRTRSEQEEEEYDDFDNYDDYLAASPPHKRAKKDTRSKPIVTPKKTPTKPAAKTPSSKKPSAKKPSTSKTKKALSTKPQASSPADGHEDNEDHNEDEDDDGDDDNESSEEDIDPNIAGNGGDSPVGIARFDIHEAATRPLTVPKQYKAGTESWNFPKPNYDMITFPRFTGGFIDPEDDIAEDDEDAEGGDGGDGGATA